MSEGAESDIRTAEKAEPARLGEVLDGTDHVLVFCHMNPDPDTLAAGVAMKYLLERRFGKEVTLCYRGIIGRAQNREMVKQLVPELKLFREIDEYSFGAAVLVDAQPQFGFNPEDLEELDVPVVACVDHHPFVASTADVPFHDVRPEVGATSTILTSYLRLFSVEPSTAVATALFYGIKTDTLGLTRRTTDADREAYEYLLPRVDHNMLMAIEAPPLTATYFRDLRDALNAARVYGRLVITHLGSLPYPDMVAEIADLLLKVDQANWSVCTGYHDDLFYVSVRTNDPDGDAGVFIRAVVPQPGAAGGHNTMAAGRIPLEGGGGERYEEVRAQFLEDVLEHFSKVEKDGVDLVA